MHSLKSNGNSLMLKESDQEKNVGSILVFLHLKLHCHNHVETIYLFLQTSKERMDLLGAIHNNYVLLPMPPMKQ